MNRRERLGSICEYHRIKYYIPLKSFLYDKNSQICSYTLYKKIMEGKSEVDKVYADIFRANKIPYKEDPVANKYFMDLSAKVKHLIENFDYEELKVLLNGVDKTQFDYYPYRFYYDVLDFIYCLFVDFGTYKRNQVTFLKMCVDMLPRDLWLSFCYGAFANIYRLSSDIDTITKEMSFIPNEYDDEIVVLIINERINRMNKLLEEAIKCVDKIVVKEGFEKMFNLQLVCFQAYHANYYALKEFEKAAYYLNKLVKIVQNHKSKLSNFCVSSSSHYLAMQFFCIHDFKKSFHFLVDNINSSVRCSTIIKLVYLHVCCVLGKEQEYFNLNEEKNLNVSHKLMFKYFDLYFNKVSKNKLYDFITNRLIGVLGRENTFERHIILEQLLLIGHHLEFEELYLHYKACDYEFFEEWDIHFDEINVRDKEVIK